jgi:ribonucleoside-diphosphate reductase alpha chain
MIDRQEGRKSKQPGPNVQNSKKRGQAKHGMANAPERLGLSLERHFTTEGRDPYDDVPGGWELRTAAITGEGGKVFFEQRDIEVPRSWSQTATNVVAQKYFRGILGTPSRERSVRQLIGRVVKTLVEWARKGRYFATENDVAVFRDELTHLLVNQKMSFNSPVWFNLGVEDEPQCSACFINSVDDSMGSILDLAKTEGMLFKYGSGTGSNLSNLRSSTDLQSMKSTMSG